MNYTPEDLEKWTKVKSMIETTLIETGQRVFYNTFIKPLELYAVTPGTIYISSNNAFNLYHMKQRFGTMIYGTVPLVFGRRYEIEYYPANEIERMVRLTDISALSDRYTFDNFIVGASNSFAHAAALAVAQMPGEAYNPLFLYSGVGLGKTHLLNAIGNYVRADNPRLKVLLMTSEAMTNELIDAIARKSTSELRAKLRSADVLMVDDIQFLGRTKTAQEEFFNTFNDLYGAQKQIVLASDRPPKELPEIEERLRSRFSWGVIVDIQKPDYETRVAILMQKADQMNLDVPYEVVEYIARNVDTNIRDLEGCLMSLDANAQLMNASISLEMAMPVLADRIVRPAPRTVTIDGVIEVVSGRYNLTPQDLTGKKRNQEIALPRQIAMYICRQMTSMSTTNIGKAFGGRDHTTVMHGCDKIAEAMKADFAFKKKIEDLIDLIEGK